MAIRKSAGYAWNLISLVGIILAVAAAGLIVAFTALELITGIEHPYLGIMTYFIFPGMLITGLLIVPIGAWRVRNQRRKAVLEGMLSLDEEIPKYPRLDLNDPSKRRMVIFFVLATVIFFVIVAVAGIKGFEFTESPTFCGELCHTVMEPEHTAWQNSPHAKVKCVECHVGPGADWYVKAKISGLRQVWAVMTHAWPTPIHTPIEHLRPARGTCEHCHWPEKFYAGRQKVFYHYAPNEENSPRETNMLIKIGGSPKSPNAMGIHWHIGREVTFIPGDVKRLTIPYVAVKGPDGKITEYMDTQKPLTRDEINKAKKRLMDCTDCHNRPTHIYHSPDVEMDMHFVSNKIDRKLPFVKKVAVELLNRPYKNKDEAFKTIAAELPAYYAKNHPKVAQEKGAAITQAVEQVKDIYSRNFFPEMKVQWNTYPNHIGHFYTPGCFRCHDGKHKTAEGKVISKDCNLCHEVLSQTQENIPAGAKVSNFVHPVDIGEDLHKVNCSDCHSAPDHGHSAAEQGAKKKH